MTGMPPKPRGSECDERVDQNGLSITWRLPDPFRSRLFSIVSSAFGVGCCVLIWIAFPVAIVAALIRGANSSEILGVIAVLLVVSFIMIWQGRIFWLEIQPLRPELIKLDAESFRYDPGTPPVVEDLSRRRNIQFHELFNHPQPVEEARSKIAFHLKAVKSQQRLYVGIADTSIEIGPLLQDRDRVWLLSVLELWRMGELWPCITKYQTDHPS